MPYLGHGWAALIAVHAMCLATLTGARRLVNDWDMGIHSSSPPAKCDPASWNAPGICVPNANPKTHLYSNASTTAAGCCARCAEDPRCVTWSVWAPTGAPGAPGTRYQCCTFSVAGPIQQRLAGCVSAGGPAPAPLPYPDRTPPGPACTDCPNIVFALTDDQDLTLGGWTPMRQTQAAIQAKGATLTEWRIHTPICSPSRSETVSGRYFHNIKSDLAVPPLKGVTIGAGTAHVNATLYVNDSFGVHLRQKKGYQVALFGKSNFNTFQGFDRWFEGAYVGNGGTWRDGESPDGIYTARHDEYSTSLIANKSINWLRRDNVSGASSGGRPFFVYFAPHWYVLLLIAAYCAPLRTDISA